MLITPPTPSDDMTEEQWASLDRQTGFPGRDLKKFLAKVVEQGDPEALDLYRRIYGETRSRRRS